jgi:hypothetical protein
MIKYFILWYRNLKSMTSSELRPAKLSKNALT